MKTVAAIVLNGFEELGVPLSPHSRLVQEANAYLDPKGVLPTIIPPDHPRFETALEGQRDLKQVAFALDQLRSVIPKEELRSRLRQIVGDNVLPQDSPDRSPGRDKQCELFVAALCMRAGLNPTFNEKPDIHCAVGSQVFGIAVKRIKAGGRFEEHIRKAADQIETSQLPGIIVADISQSLNRKNGRVSRAISNYQFDQICRLQMLRISDRFSKRVRQWTRGRPIRGIILLNHYVREHASQGWGLELVAFPMNLCLYNQRRTREFESFSEKFSQAVRNPGAIPKGS